MMASNKKGSEGTVLLRQAEPKYNFVGRKLPKSIEPSHQGKSTERISTNSNITTKTSSDNPISSVLPLQPNLTSSASSPHPFHQSIGDNSYQSQNGKRPVAIVGASFQTRSFSGEKTNVAGYSQNSLTEYQYKTPTSHLDTRLGQTFTTNSEGPTISNSAWVPQAVSIPVTARMSPSSSTVELPTPQKSTAHLSSQAVIPLQSQNATLTESDQSDTAQVVDNSAAAAALSNVTGVLLKERLQVVETERDRLKKDLDAQLEVNGELKRLLVASVGDDLSKRVERLAQDRVQLSMDIGGFNKKMTEDYENLDKISIQADMWRSKYLASRVMVEELGNARAYFSLQWHESQEALQEMLNERHELRANLLEAYKILQQVKDAFDPLNSHHSSLLPSTNVLDLSRSCQKLSEAVRFRLLPAHVAISSNVEVDMESWGNSVTRAEQYAHEDYKHVLHSSFSTTTTVHLKLNQLLSRPSEPVGSLQSGSSSVLPMTRSPSVPHINRFHPHVKHENVSIHCCHKCKGEINVV